MQAAAAASFELSFWFWMVVSWFREARDHQCLVVLLTRQNLPANYKTEAQWDPRMGKKKQSANRALSLFPLLY